MSAALQNSHVVLPLPPVTAVTVNATVAVCSASVPELPRTVTVAAPTVAVGDAVNVSVDVFVVGAAGLNAAVTPLGRPVAVSVTAPAKPFVRVMVIVDVPVAPCCTVTGLVAASVYPPTGAAV